MAGMVEWQELREWQEWRNGRKNGKMTKWQKVVTYVLFMVHADTMAEWRVEWWNGQLAGMVEWREWREWREWWNGRKNGRTDVAIYVLFMVHADTDNDTDTEDDT
jgi:hypothetical protein